MYYLQFLFLINNFLFFCSRLFQVLWDKSIKLRVKERQTTDYERMTGDGGSRDDKRISVHVEASLKIVSLESSWRERKKERRNLEF